MGKPRFWLRPGQVASPAGRISRLQYFVYGLILAVIYLTAFLALDVNHVFSVNADGQLADTSIVGAVCYGLVQLSFAWFIFANAVKRTHDLNWSGWVALLVVFDLPFDVALGIAREFTTLPPEVSTIKTVVDTVGKFGAMGIGLFLTFGQGKRGKNKYGPDPLQPPAPPIEVF